MSQRTLIELNHDFAAASTDAERQLSAQLRRLQPHHSAAQQFRRHRMVSRIKRLQHGAAFGEVRVDRGDQVAGSVGHGFPRALFSRGTMQPGSRVSNVPTPPLFLAARSRVIVPSETIDRGTAA